MTITRRRRAGPNHDVITTTGGPGYRREPCAQCPWRRDLPAGVFPAQAFRLSAPTAYDAAFSIFGCHMSETKAPLSCAGALLSEGAVHNILVRIALADGRLDLARVHSDVPLYPNYQAMAVANGVANDDPVLAQCWRPWRPRAGK